MAPKPDFDVVILAGGGHAAEVYSYWQDLEARGLAPRLLGVVDELKPAGPWEGTRVLGDFAALSRLVAQRGGPPPRYLTAVGDNRLRRSLAARAEAAGLTAAFTLVHPSAWVGRRVELGEGTLLAPGSLVTTRTRIGQHAILNVKASVGHDCVVGDFVNLNPGCTVAGNVRIGDGTFIGAGATVINGVSVGRWTVVGAGAVVIRDLPDFVTAVGVPARVIKQHPRPDDS
jgi:acetyltransferase EpsM